MPITANPLIADLVLEGIKQAGEFNPQSSLITRASGEWVEEIKNDIWRLAKKPKILQVTAYTTINTGQSRYALPSDYSSDLTLGILYGTDLNIAQYGTNDTITLAANDISGSNIIGKEILITAGVGAGSYSQIVTYDSTTKIAGVIPDFTTIPANGDTYMIIDVEYPVETRPVFDWDARYKQTVPMVPQYAYAIDDDEAGYFIFNSPPDRLYGCRLRYYADLTQVDTSSQLMSVIYRKWRNVWVQGIRMRKLRDENDDMFPDARSDYNNELKMIMYRDIYGMDISAITDRILDYQ